MHSVCGVRGRLDCPFAPEEEGEKKTIFPPRTVWFQCWGLKSDDGDALIAMCDR
jgi:hypothetical protein